MSISNLHKRYFSQNLKVGTDLKKADRQLVKLVDYALIVAVAYGKEMVCDYGVLETEENDFFSHIERIRKGQTVTPAEITSGPFREKFYRACNNIGTIYFSLL